MIKELKLTIWGREFILPVAYRCHDGDNITKAQIEAVDAFGNNLQLIEQSKIYVEQYCREDVLDDGNNLKKGNIFSYIKPEYIFVKHDEQRPRVALMCNYRYDPEHGLAVVFSADGKITVGLQDIIL